MPDAVPTCPEHPTVQLRCPACAGRRGGLVKSRKKRRAVKRNGLKGGRPQKNRS
jgi:hypothetical protein